jgi:CRISPR-associated endonuclease/helicase Cas3
VFKAARSRLVEWLVREFKALPQAAPDEGGLCLLAGLVSVADWIGSDESRFPPRREPAYTPEESRRRAEQALHAIGWQRVEINPDLSFAQLFAARGLQKPNALQAATNETIRKPGLYVVEAPMGMGKTEAALLAAYRLLASGQHHGLYFALPTQVTSDRIHERVQEFVDALGEEARQVRLIHGSSWLRMDSFPQLRPSFSGDEDDDERPMDTVRAARDWFASAKRALLAPFGVGTVDQALLGVLAAKHFFVRQFALAGKVVILDEVHAYDPYTSTLVDALIRRCLELGCTVLVLSATLTQQRRRELLQLGAPSEVPALENHHTTITGGPFKGVVQCLKVERERDAPKTIRIQHHADDPAAQGAEALCRAEAGARVLWIRNTVARAQEAYRLLACERHGDRIKCGLLHSRFPRFQRMENEQWWIDQLGKRGMEGGCVLVATQVVEQSVDIDADFLISDLAPTDMLFQRLGRLWRHPERTNRPGGGPEAELLLVHPTFPPDADELKCALSPHSWVYPPYHLLRTWKVWRERESVALPHQLRDLLEETFGPADPSEPESWRRLADELEDIRRDMKMKAEARTRVFANPALQDEEGLQTRWGEQPASLVLVSGKPKTVNGGVEVVFLNGHTLRVPEWEWDSRAAKEVCLNSLPVPKHNLREAWSEVPRWLKLHARDTCLGIVRDDGGIEVPGGTPGYLLAYTPEQGVIISKAAKAARPREEREDELGWW